MTQDELERTERMAFAGRLASALVHEARNPLNAIMANLQILEEDLRREEGEDGPNSRRVARVLGEVGRLNRIFENFLSFARGKEMRMSEVAIDEIVGEVSGLIRPRAEADGLTMLVDLDEGPRILVDPDAISQAVMNLCLNGIQSLEKGGTLIVRTGFDDKCAMIEVTDTGRGIPEGEKDRIFDLFHSTRKGGTGIGLAVVKRIVEAHGGTINLESEEGRGTSFRIRLPLSRSKGGGNE